ncbi:MAG: DMT family transporter [Desulfovibrionales bacterium]|nr:DMT family transporter [Desulfovibrionales bacterium]
MHNPSQALRGVLFALGATIIWSGNFIVARSLNQLIEPATLSFLRWAVALAALLPFAWRIAWQERAAIRKSLPILVPMAIVGVTVFNTVIYMAARTTSAINLSLIATSTPVFIMLFSRIFLGEVLNRRKILGLATALAGVLVLISGGRPERLLELEFSHGDIWMSLAAMLFATYSMLVHKMNNSLKQPVFLLALFSLGVLFLVPWAGWEVARYGWPQLTPGAVGAILYIGLGASLASYSLWASAIAAIGPSLAGLIYYTLPLFSGIAAFFILDEPMGWPHLVSGACIFGGITLATRSRK